MRFSNLARRLGRAARALASVAIVAGALVLSVFASRRHRRLQATAG